MADHFWLHNKDNLGWEWAEPAICSVLELGWKGKDKVEEGFVLVGEGGRRNSLFIVFLFKKKYYY